VSSDSIIKRLKIFINRILGSTSKIPFELFTIRVGTIVGSLAPLITFLANFFLQKSFELGSVLVVQYVLFALLYYLTNKVKSYAFLLYSLVLLSLSSVLVEWYYFNGYDGGAFYIFLVVVAFYAMMSKGIHSYITLGISAIFMITLSFIEFYKPEVVLKYLTHQIKVADLTLAIFFCMLIIFIMIKVFMKITINVEKISERNKVLQEQNSLIIRQKQELEQLNEQKDRFLSIIAHDLRNPIGGIANSSNYLLQEFESFDNEEKRELIELIESSSKGVYTLLEQLLDWASTQSKNYKMFKDNISLGELLNPTLDLLKQQAINKNIAIINNIDTNLYVFTDKIMIATVIRNLLSNAIKFTKEGGQINIKSQIIDGGYVSIVVSDTGVGMSDDQIASIFNFGKKVATRGTNNEKGNGLGLILCKEFIEKLGGKIWVESKVNEGTSFYFTIQKNITEEESKDAENQLYN
jgi:signal transduction histidine kinase